jgi:hypothetical protein
MALGIEHSLIYRHNNQSISALHYHFPTQNLGFVSCEVGIDWGGNGLLEYDSQDFLHVPRFSSTSDSREAVGGCSEVLGC